MLALVLPQQLAHLEPFSEGDLVGALELAGVFHLPLHYDQLWTELDRHAFRVQKYIVIHDTLTHGYTDEHPASEVTLLCRRGLGRQKLGDEGILANNNGRVVSRVARYG